MPRGRQQKAPYLNNIIQVTPKNGRKSKNAKIAQKTTTSSARQTQIRKSARKSSSVLSRERKPWEGDSDEEEKPVYSRDYFSNSDMDSEFDDQSIKEELEDEISEGEIGETFSIDAYASEDILCPWKEMPAEQLPPLDLPCSSLDLLVDKDYLFDTLEVYEFLRTYFHVIQISPFLFEDFCCALRASVQSKLLCEIHIAFIRILFRDDEDEQTIYSVQDTNTSFNVLFQMLEPMTFAEILRQYVESDNRFSTDILKILQNTNYPFVELEKRLIVFRWLCDRFMETNTFKRTIKNEGKIFYEEHCRDCGKAGDVLLCDGCEAIYHLTCANLEEVPLGKWLCQICELHQVKGVTTGLQTGQKEGRFNRRVQSLGYDRHGRLYWFLARRIFVQDIENKELYYFSSMPQLYELLTLMDPYYYEARLFRVLIDLSPVIAEQMRITLELTDERRKNLQNKTQRESPQPYLHVDNIHRMSKILTDSIFSDKEIKEEASTEITGIITKREGIAKVRDLLRIQDGHLTEDFWSGGYTEDQLLDYYNRLENEYAYANSSGTMDGLVFLEEIQERTHKGYRLGFSDAEYRDYINQYSVNEYAKSPYQRAKDRDRRKYMCSRFSLADEGEFNWTILKNRDCYMSETEIGRIIQLSLRKLLEKLPDELMHRLWQGNEKYRYLQLLQQSTSASDLKQLLLQFEKALRKPVFGSVWWNSLGHTKLIRVTPEDREKKQKLDLMKKKEERSLVVADINEESDIVWVKYTRYNGPPKHNIWRLKDEQFRVNGRDALGGWIWVSSTLVRKFLPLPKIPPLNINFSTSENMLKTRETIKAKRLDKLIKSLSTCRTINERIKLSRRNLYSCYSDSCRLISSNNSLALRALSLTTQGEFLSCYNSSCFTSKFRVYETDTTEIVKAFKPFKLNPYNLNALKARHSPENTLGEGRPFPLKRPFDYLSKSGKRSILMLPKEKLARQGGLNSATIVPGFHRTSKSNSSVWNYPCQRPLFDNCWRYMVCKSNSLHSIALQFRIMYACIRWADMDSNSEDEDTRVWVHHPDYDEVRMVIGHRENPPEGYYEQYKLQIEQFSIDESTLVNNREDDSEDYRVPSARPKSTRKRKKNQSEQKFKHKRTAILERWMDGVDLKLYEIRDYWKKYFNSQTLPVMVKREQSVIKREPNSIVYTPITSSFGSARTTPMLNGSSKRTQMKQPNQQFTSFSAPRIQPRPQPLQTSINFTPSNNHFILDSRRRFAQAINFNSAPRLQPQRSHPIQRPSINLTPSGNNFIVDSRRRFTQAINFNNDPSRVQNTYVIRYDY